MAKRVQSPSSLNTFKQCKRKYFYQYIEKLPTSSSIYTIRGNICHEVLEDFFDIDTETLTQDSFGSQFKIKLQRLLVEKWGKYKAQLSELGLDKETLQTYFQESMMMVLNWSDHFLEEFKTKLTQNNSLEQAFKELTPIRELEYRSEDHGVRGFIDAIQHIGEEVHIIDYKTSKRSDVKDSMKLQLAIYALMYEEKHKILPSKVGIFFLRDTLKLLDVDPEMVERAKKELKLIHNHTENKEEVYDYPKTITGLCKWKTGQCDFYETCQPHNRQNRLVNR
tara:strand:- start:1982 stop:2818 length:837 start_codon:yes stop_codon:yes gene_type:complete